MARTVNEAFDEFLATAVRLDRDVSTRARDSRNWLINQLHSLADGTTDLPDPYADKTYQYGSFARRTKIRELDDIDLILALKANGATYLEQGQGKYTINVPENATYLRSLCNDGTDVLNSKRVINRVLKELARVPQYSRAEMKRNGSAAVLDLSSYTWVFDIVPAFFTATETDGRTYYLIPDGEGSWMKTDPRIDQANITDTNRLHGGNLLDLIRLVKYWNRRQTMPSISSYLIECFVVSYVQQRTEELSDYPDLNIGPFLDYFRTSIFCPVNDPKNIDGDINKIEFEDCFKISNVAERDLARVRDARSAEDRNDHKSAISKWIDIFGEAFPSYS